MDHPALPLGAILSTDDSSAFHDARAQLSAWSGVRQRQPKSEVQVNPDALRVGPEVLVKAQLGPRVAYLLGTLCPGGLVADSVRFVFLATTPCAADAVSLIPELQAFTGPQAVLCCARNDSTALNSTLGTLQSAAPVDGSAGGTLEHHAISGFMQSHPQARLVDVREPGEVLAGGPVQLYGHRPEHAALSRFANHVGPWLAASATPLVFVCRTGARAERAAASLRRMGHRSAWHLAGGLALQPDQAA
jgi:rhodanese-related sulfurtransferase